MARPTSQTDFTDHRRRRFDEYCCCARVIRANSPRRGNAMRRFLLALTFVLLTALPATAAETADAVWKQQEIEFSYLSLVVAYSCELMEARIKMLLRHVGAADDIEVTMQPCTGYDRPQRRLRITARFSTLAPAGDGDVEIVKAAWSEVQLGKRHPRSIDDSDCELLEHFQEHLLSKIEHEVIEGNTGCDATRRSTVGHLKLKVLKPVAADVGAEKDD